MPPLNLYLFALVPALVPVLTAVLADGLTSLTFSAFVLTFALAASFASFHLAAASPLPLKFASMNLARAKSDSVCFLSLPFHSEYVLFISCVLVLYAFSMLPSAYSRRALSPANFCLAAYLASSYCLLASASSLLRW